MVILTTLFVVFLLCLNTALSEESATDLLNKCLKSGTQKLHPSREASLYGKCSPWKDNSCCSDKTARDIHMNATWLDFKWNHCPGKPLPEACKDYFILDLCFYECSPNKGPWIQEVDQKLRKERFVGMPLCESQCLDWWDACKGAYTCQENWSAGFEWSGGVNECPADATCRPFSQVYANSVAFCENIWNGSWKVVPYTQSCVKLSFTGPNPNDKVALEQVTGSAGELLPVQSHTLLVLFSTVYALAIFFI